MSGAGGPYAAGCSTYDSTWAFTLAGASAHVDRNTPQGGIEKNPLGRPQWPRRGAYWMGACFGAGAGVDAATGFGVLPGGADLG